MSISPKIEAYEKARKAREEAEQWWALRECIDVVNERRFKVSAPHCHAKITIRGQHGSGGQDYHESPEALNKELAAVLAVDEALVLSAIQRLRDKEQALALDASAELEGVLATIKDYYKGDCRGQMVQRQV